MRFAVLALPFYVPLLLSLACSSAISGKGLAADGGSSSAGPSGSSRTSCNASGEACSCTFAGAGAGNAEACNATRVQNAVCCADVGWPDRNLSCQCQRYTCKRLNGTGSDSCECSTYENGNLDS